MKKLKLEFKIHRENQGTTDTSQGCWPPRPVFFGLQETCVPSNMKEWTTHTWSMQLIRNAKGICHRLFSCGPATGTARYALTVGSKYPHFMWGH